MKAAPGTPKSGNHILGREYEITELWRKLDLGSVLFTAERRVGKTCLLRKMMENPPQNRAVVMCWIEKSRHPSELVGRLFDEAKSHSILSRKANWLIGIRKAYEKLAGAELGGWKLPAIQSVWKRLFEILIEDIVQNSDHQVILMFDELPHMLNNLVADGNAALAAELLDTLRELRQHHQGSGKFRFVLAGSIGLHLIVDELKKHHGYRGNPTNDLIRESLSGMSDDDVALLCREFLDEEGIERAEPEKFNRRMATNTDGLPLYIEYVCEAFQAAKRKQVGPADIDVEIRHLLDSSAVDWFRDAAERIDTHYARLGVEGKAREILKHLCQAKGYVAETEIMAHIRSQMTVEHDDEVLAVLELLREDHYLTRKVTRGQRRYRFLYEIMRRWWRLNRG